MKQILFLIVFLGIGLGNGEVAFAKKSGGRLVLAVGDKLEKGDPYRFDEIKRSYERSARLALDHFRSDNPSVLVDPEIVFFLEDSPIDKIFEKIVSSNALAVVGFKRTPSAKAATTLADKHKITMISPVSPIDEVVSGFYSRGLAFPLSKTKPVIQDFGKDFKSKFIILKQDAPLANAHEVPKDFVAIDDLDKEEARKKIPDGSLLFFPGYAYEHLGAIKKLLSEGKTVTLLGSTPWAYSEDLLRRYSLNCEIYSVSQFFDRTISTSQINSDSAARAGANRFVGDYKKIFGEVPESSAHSFYDGMSLALSKIYLEHAKTREQFYQKMQTFDFKGITGKIAFKNGKSERAGYLVKWTRDHFEPIKVYSQ